MTPDLARAIVAPILANMDGITGGLLLAAALGALYCTFVFCWNFNRWR